mmetsp:Transcript_22972/g.34239  ORF Transcript_22972/g.34239 Transcript_22972/m.34239 type:complete len:316 (-) Transcript_22972:242-1189(-)
MATHFGIEAVVWSALLAIQFGLQPDITATFASREIIPTAAVVLQEGFLKVAIGLGALILSSGKRHLRNWTIGESFRKAGIPALLYAVQNLLTLLAFQRLDGLTYNVLNQSKLIWNAVLVHTFLGENFSTAQIVSLGIVIFTTVLVTFDPNKEVSKGTEGTSYYLGVIYTLIASAISGTASTVIQYNLQKLKRNSYLMSAELGFYSACFLLVKLIFEGSLGIGDGNRVFETSFFHGFTLVTIIPFISTSAGGIVVGQVTKYVGGVGKAYALVVGLILSSFLHEVTWRLAISIPLIIVSFWLKFRQVEKVRNVKKVN